MEIELRNLHTIVMFIGISGSGKSTKAGQLDELAKKEGLRSVILSSDNCRHELLLSDDYHHHDTEMSQISDKAFDLLMHKAELYMEWPYNVNLLIMDMMNLQTEARQKIIDLSNKHCYDIIAIVMDYQNIDEYFKGLDKKYNRRIISRQLHKFHRDTLPELGRKLYNDLIRIKSKEEPIELSCRFHIGLRDTQLPEDKHYFIVGDIHECLESFKALIKKAGFSIEKINENGKEIEKVTGKEDVIIITVGDILDKGNKTKETIEFMYNNMDRILHIWGGHEGFIRKWLKTDIKWKSPEDITFYTSIPILEKDEELRKKFFVLCEHMKPFFNAKYFTVTHTGCESKYIGKTQKYAVKAQRYYHVERDSIDDDIWLSYRRESLKYLKDEAEACHPLHIFGHESWKNCFIYKNKINLDTGCVSGGRLTGIKINKYGRYKLYHVDCLDEVILTNEKLREFTFEEPKIELDELEERDYKRLINLTKNKINFISGTMCPADKMKKYRSDNANGFDSGFDSNGFDSNGFDSSSSDSDCSNVVSNNNCVFRECDGSESIGNNMVELEDDDLESIDRALDYFRHQGIDKVMLQIKYMGSRCNIYLFDEVEKSYAVSRNGFLIRNPDLQEGLLNIYKKLRERLSDYFKDKDLEMMIIDGELMPWFALGEEVIDSTFQAINKGIRSELDLLKNNCFEEQLAKLKTQYQESQFDADRCNMKKEELYDKYGAQKYESYKMLSKFYIPKIDALEKMHELYATQLEIYAPEYNEQKCDGINIYYQPFSILKSVKKNGDEIYYFDSDNETLFNMVNDEEYAICDLTSDGYEKARIFFDHITKEFNLEGIVVKPLKVDIPGCAPYIKVRSPNYLTIIYGYDYLDKVKYGKFIEQKHIFKKLEKSIAEWKLGKKLLQIPYNNISEDNSKYMDLMAKMIIETNDEADIDPRL